METHNQPYTFLDKHKKNHVKKYLQFAYLQKEAVLFLQTGCKH